MSKFLVTERELRNALFKTFLKKPHLLKEAPNPPTEEDKIAQKDQISAELAGILKTSATSQMNAARKADLVRLTLRRNYLDNNYFFKLDPGASIFDYFISDYQNDPEWTNANDIMQGGYEQWLQRTLETFQISTGMAPMVSTRLVKKKAFFIFDAAINLYSAINNYQFSEFLEEKKDTASYLKKYLNAINTIKSSNNNIVTKSGIKNFILNSLTDEAASADARQQISDFFNNVNTLTKNIETNSQYFFRDNLEIILGLNVDKKYPNLLKIYKQNSSLGDDDEIRNLGETQLKIVIGKNDQNNDLEAVVNEEDIGNEDWWYFTYAICDSLSLIPVLGFLMDAGLNTTVEKEVLGNLAANKNKEAPLYTYNPDIDAFEMRGTNTAEIDATDEATKTTYSADPKAKSQAPFTTGQSSDEMRHAIDKTMQDMAESMARATTVDTTTAAYKNMSKAYMTEFFKGIKSKISEIFKNGRKEEIIEIWESIPGILDEIPNQPRKNDYFPSSENFNDVEIPSSGIPQKKLVIDEDTGLPDFFSSLSAEKQDQFLKQFYNIATSDNYKINKKNIFEDFKKITTDLGNADVNKNLPEIVDKVIENVDNAELTRNPILEILLKSNIQQVNLEKITKDQLQAFILYCSEISGASEKEIYDRILKYVTSSVRVNTGGNPIIISDLDTLYNLIQIAKRQDQTTSPLRRALQGSLDELYDISKNKSIPTNIKNIKEIFSSILQKEYAVKLKKIKDAILSQIKDMETINAINDELKKIPMNKAAIKKILEDKNIIVTDIDNLLNLYERNLDEVFEYLIDCHFFLNLRANKTDVIPKMKINELATDRELLNLLPDEINLNRNEFTVYRSLYKKLKESNKFQKYFYDRKLTRFYNAMNSDKASAFEVFNDFINKATGNTYAATTHKELTEQLEKLGIPALIDGTLKINPNNFTTVATNIREFHLYIMRVLKRCLLTFELISNPKKVTQKEYIDDLINYKIIESPPTEDLRQFAVPDNTPSYKVGLEKNANEGIDTSKKATTFFEKLKDKLLNFFLDTDEVYAQVPELMQSQEIAKIADISESLKINGITPKNLAQELKNIDNFMPKILDIIDEEIEIITKMINDIKSTPGLENNPQLKFQLTTYQFQLEILTNFRKETTLFINNMRTSIVGSQGYRIIDQSELIPATKGGQKPGKNQTKSGWDTLMEYISLPRLDQDRIQLLDKIINWFKYMKTGFIGREIKNLIGKLSAFDFDKTKLEEVLTSFFTGLYERAFKQARQHVGMTKKVFSLNNLNWVSSITSGIHAVMLVSLISNVGFLTCLATFFWTFAKTFLLGYFSKVVLLLFSSKVEALQRLAEGMLTEIIKSSSKILKFILKYSHSYEDEYRRLSIQKFASSNEYMNRVNDFAYIDDPTQHNIIGKSIIQHIGDIFTSKQDKKNELVTGAQSQFLKNNLDLFSNLEKLYKLYNTLRDTLTNPGTLDRLTKCELYKDIFRKFNGIFKNYDNNKPDSNGPNNTIFINNFKLAVIYVLSMEKFEENSGSLKPEQKEGMASDIYDLLEEMYKIRKNLKPVLAVIGSDLQLLDNAGFNADSLITGGWYNIKEINKINFSYSFAEQYSYDIVINKDSTKLIPHFQKQTSITTSGNESAADGSVVINTQSNGVNNFALELYSFYKAKETHPIEGLGIPHSHLFKPVRDIYYSIQLGLNQLEDINEGTVR